MEFVWIGKYGLGDPYYFRIHSPVVFVEFDFYCGSQYPYTSIGSHITPADVQSSSRTLRQQSATFTLLTDCPTARTMAKLSSPRRSAKSRTPKSRRGSDCGRSYESGRRDVDECFVEGLMTAQLSLPRSGLTCFASHLSHCRDVFACCLHLLVGDTFRTISVPSAGSMLRPQCG